jgi:uncharacterized protein
MTRVVLDTNLFVAAYWNRRSASAEIIAASQAGEVNPVYTPEIEQELWRIMDNIGARAEFRAMVSNTLGRSEQVDPWTEVDVRTDDPEDQKFLVCAVSADADYIITSDDHLLRLGAIGRTLIVRPVEFRRQVLGK